MHSPIDPEAVTDDLVREYHGQRVAFCCSQCVVRWDQITDEEKDELLSALEELGENARQQMHDMTGEAAEQMHDMTGEAAEQMEDMRDSAARRTQDK